MLIPYCVELLFSFYLILISKFFIFIGICFFLSLSFSWYLLQQEIFQNSKAADNSPHGVKFEQSWQRSADYKRYIYVRFCLADVDVNTGGGGRFVI